MVDIENIDLSNIYVYQIKLPDRIDEYVTPCFDGYTVYLNENLSYEQKKKAFAHALFHISNGDFDKSASVQEIESTAHAS